MGNWRWDRDCWGLAPGFEKYESHSRYFETLKDYFRDEGGENDMSDDGS